MLAIWRGAIVCGLLIVVVAAVLALMNIGGMSTSMPTQVPPLRVARRVLFIGVGLLAVGLVGIATHQ